MKSYKSLTAIVFVFIFWLCLTAVLWAGSIDPESVQYRIQAERWAQAEAIFHVDPRWLGGDGAATVDLGGGRVLWLFGDSFVELSGRGDRSSAVLVRNCIAIQTGYDPTRAEMQFFWKTDGSGPAAFFRNKGDTWLWPASGIVVGRHLLVFMMEIQPADNDLGFTPMGWKAAWVDNVQARPDRWHVTWLVSPRQQNMVVGIGTPIFQDGYLHVFAAKGGGDEVYLVRWPGPAVKKGTLTTPGWWAGKEKGWIDLQSDGIPPAPVFTQGQMEFSVAYHDGMKRYVRVQTKRFLNPCLSIATASVLTGPWTDPVCFYTPPAQGDPDLLIYAGKHHPMLAGADMVVSYVVNTLHADRLISNMQLYYPVLLKGGIVEDYSVYNTGSSGPDQ